MRWSLRILDAFVIPPGNKPGREILERDHPDIHIARYDLVVQIETKDLALIKTLQNNSTFIELRDLLKNAASYFYTVVAKNVPKIGEVDKNCKGIFLYNYFYAADSEAVLPVWEYTGR